MKAIFLVLPIITTLFLGSLFIPSAFAQYGGQAGGVDKEGSWYVGEGLKKGDFFSYKVCWVDHKECTAFEMDMWIKGDIQTGSETKWLAEVVVYDGAKIIKGEMELGKVTPEPTGGSEELGIYRGVFKSSIAWLSAFATSDGSAGGKGPKNFDAVSWGKIGNIGGEQVLPSGLETITVPAGTWETVLISWKTGGSHSYVWIVDDFPFPIKAHTLTHVSEGIPPPEYIFELLKYEQYVQQSPFKDVISTVDNFASLGCDTDFDREVSIKKPTNNFQYQIHIFYGPEDPVQGCEMSWLIKFFNKFDDTEFLNQVQYDMMVVDDKLTIPPLRSIADEENRNFLYSPSGQPIIDMIVKEEPGIANFLIYIYGTSPEVIVPSEPDDYLLIPITIFARDDSFTPTTPTTVTPTPTTPTTVTPTPAAPLDIAPTIPSWIKSNAGWWADEIIDDDSFIQGIKFLIEEDVLKIPSTVQGSSSGSDSIPSWIKSNAGWWADGTIDDDSFILAIQFLIKEGIISLS